MMITAGFSTWWSAFRAAGPVLERGDLDPEGRVGVPDGPLEGARQGGLEDVAVAGVEGGLKPGVDRALGVALAQAAVGLGGGVEHDLGGGRGDGEA